MSVSWPGLPARPGPTQMHSMYCTLPPTAVHTSPAAVPGADTRSAHEREPERWEAGAGKKVQGSVGSVAFCTSFQLGGQGVLAQVLRNAHGRKPGIGDHAHLRCCAPRSALAPVPPLPELHPPQSAAAAAASWSRLLAASRTFQRLERPRGPPRLTAPPPAHAAGPAAGRRRQLQLLQAAPPSCADRHGQARAAPACCRGRTGAALLRLRLDRVPRRAVLHSSSWPPTQRCLPPSQPRHAPPTP